MPPLIERNQSGQLQDIADIVANIVSEKTPATSMLRKESEPNQKKMDYQVETYPDASFDGVMDNADVDAFDSVPREEVTAVQQLYFAMGQRVLILTLTCPAPRLKSMAEELLHVAEILEVGLQDRRTMKTGRPPPSPSSPPRESMSFFSRFLPRRPG